MAEERFGGFFFTTSKLSVLLAHGSIFPFHSFDVRCTDATDEDSRYVIPLVPSTPLDKEEDELVPTHQTHQHKIFQRPVVVSDTGASVDSQIGSRIPTHSSLHSHLERNKMIFPKMTFLSAGLVWSLVVCKVQSFAPSIRTVPKVNTVLLHSTTHLLVDREM